MARTLFDTRRKFKVKAVGVETVTYDVADQLSQQLNRYRNHQKTYSQLSQYPSTQVAYLFSSLQTNRFGQFHQIERPLHCLFQT